MNTTCTELNTIDLRNASSFSSFIYRPYELILLNFVWPTISLTGLVGNALFIWAVIKVSALHTSTFIALSVLACTDSLSLIGRLVEHFSQFLTSPLRYGESSILASIGGNLLWVCFAMSLWLITLVSTERFLAICHPIKYRVIVKGPKMMMAVIGVLAVISVGFGGMSIPFLFDVAEYCILWPPAEQFTEYPRKGKLVIFNYFPELSDPYFLSFTIIILTSTIILCIINCYLNLRTLKTLKARTHNRGLQISTQFERNIRQASVMVMANTVAFFACISIYEFMLMSQILNVVEIRLFNEYQHVDNITHTFVVINSSINPLVYYITNHSYRQSFKETICGFCKSRQSKSSGVLPQVVGMCKSHL